MIGLIIYLTALIVAVGCGVLAAYYDWKGLTIANIYPSVIAISFFVAFVGQWLSGNEIIFGSLMSHLFSGLIMFGLTLMLFLTIKFGAGDSKLLTAYAFWFEPMALVKILFLVSVFGFLLALFALFVKRVQPFKNTEEGTWLHRLQKGENAIPFGIAITGGLIVAFLSQGFVDPETLECFLKTSCS